MYKEFNKKIISQAYLPLIETSRRSAFYTKKACPKKGRPLLTYEKHLIQK